MSDQIVIYVGRRARRVPWEPHANDDQAFALLAWLHRQPGVLLSFGGDYACCTTGSGDAIDNDGISLDQFLIDSVAAVMAARRNA